MVKEWFQAGEVRAGDLEVQVLGCMWCNEDTRRMNGKEQQTEPTPTLKGKSLRVAG